MDTITKIELSPQEKKIINSLLQEHIPTLEVWAYGSRVKGNSQPESDLDLVVFAEGEKEKRAIFNLQEDFEESNLPFRVELFIWSEIPESFRINIEAEHIILQKGTR